MVSLEKLCSITLTLSSHTFFSASRSSNLPSYDLSLGEENVNGTFAFLSSPFVFGDEQIEAIVLLKQVSDFADVRSETNPIVVSLLPDGSGVLVQEPSLPSFLKNDAYKFYEDLYSEMSLAFRTSHIVSATALSNDPVKQTKKYILRFPTGMTGKMGYMNQEKGLEVTGHVQITNSSVQAKNKKKIQFSHVTIRFIIALNTEEPKLLKSKPKIFNNVEDLLEDMSTLDMDDEM